MARRLPPAARSALNILHIVRQYAPGVGGLENYVAMLAQAQLAQGHDVTVVTLDRIFDGDGARLPAEDTIDGVRVRRVPFFGSRRYALAPGVLRRLGDADIVHIHAVDSFVDMLSWTRLLHRKPLVLSTHGGFFHTGFAQRFKRIFFQTVTRASLLNVSVILASSVQDQALFSPLWPRKTKLIENGVDLARFRGLARSGRRRMIYFGRIAPNKGLDRLLVWFRALRDRDPSWELLIAGKPMGVDLATLRDQADRLDLSAVVGFHDTPSDEDLRELIAGCSVFVSASHYEGFGIAAVEAVAAGLYPVLSDIPSLARTRDRIGFGTLVDFTAPPAPDLFLHDVRNAEAAPPSRDTLDRLLAPFAWQGVAASIEAIYHNVLGHRVRHIGNVDIAVLEREAALATIVAAVAERLEIVIGFCNAHTVNVATRNRAFAAALGRKLIFNDGIGIEIASKMLYGRRFPSNLNGTDLIPEALARLPHGTRIFLLGSASGIADRAGRRLAERFPNIVIAGTAHGFFTDEEEPEIVAHILGSRADLVIVGMGQPLQEFWAGRNIDRLDCPVICVGALLDFQSGHTRRAPKFVQRMGLEWAFRLAMEPRRLSGRYLLGNLVFLARITLQWLSSRRSAV